MQYEQEHNESMKTMGTKKYWKWNKRENKKAM